jgi:hypothetical protein
MPKSSREDMAALRAQALERDQGCRWPSCDRVTNYNNPLEMAHLRHRGMGGSTEVNTLDEVVMLCRIHHNCLDGRTGLGTLRWELGEMLRTVILADTCLG